MAVGRISGPLLKANLLRQGVDLAFETDLLYLDVVNGRIGIKTASPQYDLDVNGTVRTTNLVVPTQADIATFTISGDTIASSSNTINLEPATGGAVVYQGRLFVNNNLEITSDTISTTVTDADLNINTLGTGEVNINSNAYVDGNLHVTGNITADGDIVIGDSNTDSISFNADIASNIVPDLPNTYTLGEVGKEWLTSYINNIQATNIVANGAIVNGIDITLPQGNIYYVAKNGLDTNAGEHENNPFLTIKHALSVATAGDTVYVYPGTYEEILPLEIPAGVTVRGASLRSVTIKPTAATMYLDVFHMNGEATLEDFTLTGFYHDPTGTYPEFPGDTNGTGHSVRFSYGCLTQTRSPYIRNITVITRGTPSVLSINSIKTEVKDSIVRIAACIKQILIGVAPTKSTGNPLDPDMSGPTFSLAFADSIKTWIEANVNYIIDNGTLKVNLPPISANGALFASTTDEYLAAQVIAANKEFLKEEAYAYAVTTYPLVTFNETYTKRDAGIIVDAVAYDLPRGGNEHLIYAGIGFWVQPTNDPYGYDRGDAGHGALIDGEVLDPACYNRAMLFHSVTFITPAAETMIAKNGVRVEWLNSFTYFADKGFYLTSGPNGFAGQGKTKLRIDTRTGTWNIGNTVTYYDTDGTTVLASGTIDSIDGNYVYLTGKCLGFETITDRAGKTVYAQGDAKLSTSQKKFGTASLSLDGTGDYANLASTPDFNFGQGNRVPKNITVTGDAVVSAAQSKFGGSSILFDGTGDKITVDSSSDFAFGTGNFTAEAWIYRNVLGTHCIFDFRSATAGNNGILLFSNNTLQYFVNGSVRISVSVAGTVGAWTHIALVRSSGTTTLYANGSAVGTPYVDSYSYVASTVTIGAYYNNVTYFSGYIDEVRISNTARYTGTFTPSTSAFTHDQNSVLLVHGDSTITDDAGSQTAGVFAIEGFIYPQTAGGFRTIFEMRTTNIDTAIFVGLLPTNEVYVYVNGSIVIQSPSALSFNTWTHIALTRQNQSLRLFINGVQAGSTYTDTYNYAQRPLRIGATFDNLSGFVGYVDDIRVSKGVSRYTGTFTPPASALTGDLNTVLLLHFNGANNSTTFLDDGVTLQDLRTSAGGTATLINFADYSEFGAEIRSIGSACVYGEYGAYGDGDGVTAYLVSHNFAYVGSGKLSTNDPNDRITANEVVKLNRAKIYRTSVDNEGNFRVGDNFYVNQKTGEVLFDNQAVSVTSVEGVVFTDGVNTTTLTPTDITTGNIRISGNTISSLAGDINVTAASGAINLQNNTYITGNLDVTGDVTIGGNIQIGDQTTDTISFVAGINSDLIPATNTLYDLGTSALRWNNAYLSRVEVDGVVIDSNTVQTTVGNDDLTLIANGTGRVYIPSNDVQINQSLTVTQDFTVSTGTSYLKNTGITGTVIQNGDFNQTGNFTTSGTLQTTNLTVTGTITLPQLLISANSVSTLVSGTDLNLVANGTGNVVFEDIKIQDNVIKSISTNADITLTPQGTGKVIVNSTQSLQIPVGTTSERPGTPTNGMIRYNTDLSQYEGYNSGYWLKLGGIADASGNTRILPELTPGSNNNVIYFYANNNLTAYMDSTKLFAERFQTLDLDISGNTITTLTTNSNLNLTTTGTGGVRMGNLKIFNNTITNVVSNAVTEFVQSGDGYVRIPGTNGVVIPAGDTLTQRPTTPELGMMRFNIDGQLVEVYNGVSWSSVAGASGGVTSAEATEIGITSALIFG